MRDNIWVILVTYTLCEAFDVIMTNKDMLVLKTTQVFYIHMWLCRFYVICTIYSWDFWDLGFPDLLQKLTDGILELLKLWTSMLGDQFKLKDFCSAYCCAVAQILRCIKQSHNQRQVAMKNIKVTIIKSVKKILEQDCG